MTPESTNRVWQNHRPRMTEDLTRAVATLGRVEAWLTGVGVTIVALATVVVGIIKTRRKPSTVDPPAVRAPRTPATVLPTPSTGCRGTVLSGSCSASWPSFWSGCGCTPCRNHGWPPSSSPSPSAGFSFSLFFLGGGEGAYARNHKRKRALMSRKRPHRDTSEEEHEFVIAYVPSKMVDRAYVRTVVAVRGTGHGSTTWERGSPHGNPWPRGQPGRSPAVGDGHHQGGSHRTAHGA